MKVSALFLPDHIHQTRQSFWKKICRVLGVVLNKVDLSQNGYYGRYGKYGKYGKYGRYGKYDKYGAYSPYEKAEVAQTTDK